MIKELLVWIVLIMPTILEVTLDRIDIKRFGTDRHKSTGDLLVRGSALFFAGFLAHLISPDKAIWQGAVLALGMFVMFFDYIMGYLLTKNPFYLGKTSQSDRFLSEMPWYGILFFRGVLFVSTIATYYQLDKIVGV